MAVIFKDRPRPKEIPRARKKGRHDELCEVGRRWMLRTGSSKGGCMQVALSEVGSNQFPETPDVFGIDQRGESCLVEVKVSRSDFLADAKKPFRANPDDGMGDFRYYMCPPDIIKPEDLEGTKWGLIYVSPKGICKVIRGKATNNTYKKEWDAQWRFIKNQAHEDILVRTLFLRMTYNLDVSGYLDGVKAHSKLQQYHMKGDPVASMIHRVERADMMTELKAIISSIEESECPRCIERRCRDLKRMTRGVERLAKQKK
ncbi:coil containing protein [Vibrio phage vB_VpS_PG28]|nr:coil containing protein [Vibrio phage vB_VpS_PG28]